MKQLLSKEVVIAVGIVLLLTMAFVWFLGRQSKKEGKGEVVIVSPGGGVNPEFDPAILAQKAYHELTKWWLPDYEYVFDALYFLTNDELALVYNKFNEEYSKDKTLTEYVKAAWYWGEKKTLLISKLESFNLL